MVCYGVDLLNLSFPHLLRVINSDDS